MRYAVSSAEFGLGARGRWSQPAGAGVVRDLLAIRGGDTA